MKVVKVYGALKERLGGVGTFEFDVFNAAEAIKALCANFSGLDKWFIDSGDDGIVYKVLLGESEIDEDNAEQLFHPWSEQDVFHITPVLAGSGGVGRFFAGVAMIGLVVATGGAGAALGGSAWGWGAANAAAWAAKGIVAIGGSLMLGGISEMISPTPKPTSIKQANTLQSNAFSGITNVATQGGAVPIVYGRCFIGSVVLSSALDIVEA
tara:strand:- start:3093 stop:3722 length:630 start_codon:yes stop_codon:yes gene_type:complete